jgi:hypothetical protein
MDMHSDDLSRPMYFYLPFARRQNEFIEPKHLLHKLEFQQVTSVHVSYPFYKSTHNLELPSKISGLTSMLVN